MSEQRARDFQKTVCELRTENIRQQREISQLRDRIHKVYARAEQLHQERIDLRTANENLMRTIHATKQTLDQVWSKVVVLENNLAKEKAYSKHLESKIVIMSNEIADLQDQRDLLEDQKAELQNLASSSK